VFTTLNNNLVINSFFTFIILVNDINKSKNMNVTFTILTID